MAKKKLGKAKKETEEERLAREEAERLAKVAEDKIIAEEAERQRLEEVRITAERKVYRKEEFARLSEELIEINDQLMQRRMKLQAEQKKEAARVEWATYKDPTDQTDANIEKDMNTFISTTNNASVRELKDALELIKTVEIVVRSVENVWSESLARGDDDCRKRCLNNLITLQNLMLEKIDTATVQLLKFADSMLNDRLELNVEDQADRFAVGFWSSYNDIRPIRKSVQLEKMGIQLDIPKQLFSQHEKFIYRLIRVPLSTFNHAAYDMDPADSDSSKRSKYVLGGLIQFDILSPSPPPFNLRAKKWILRDCSANANNLKKNNYPSSVPSRMSIKVPADIVMTEDVRVGVWDEEQKDWTEDGITELQYSEESRTLQFYITTVGTLALVKNRVADMPYKKWSIGPTLNMNLASELTKIAKGSELHQDPDLYLPSSSSSSLYPPLYERQARLTIETKKIEVVIDVVHALCRLIKPDTAAFEDIRGKLLTPGVLLSELRGRGINLLPTNADLKQVPDTTPKNTDLEQAVLKELSKGVTGMDFHSSSEWNKLLSESQIGVRVRESSAYTCPAETFDYECVLVEEDAVSQSYKHCTELGLLPSMEGSTAMPVKYCLVMGDEYGDKEWSRPLKEVHAPRPAEVEHMELSRSLKDRVTSEAKERVERTNPRFQETVHTLLSLIKPFSIS